MSGRSAVPQAQNKGFENSELYERVEIVPPSQPKNRYTESSFQAQSSSKTSTPVAVHVARKKEWRGKTLLVALTILLLLCLLVVCLVAVILYSPQVRTSTEDTASSSAQRTTMEDLLSRIEQLERRVEQLQKIQGTNYTLATLTSLMEESVEASISRLSAFDSTVTSQFVSMQNLIQSMSSVQNNLREDLDRLRSVDLYQSCSQDTRSCTMSTGGNSNYYWRSCSTSGVSINPTSDYMVDVRCEYSNNYGYIESSTIYKSGNNYYCYCDVTRLSSSTSSFHSTLTSSFSTTCTLTVTTCPHSVNLLS